MKRASSSLRLAARLRGEGQAEVGTKIKSAALLDTELAQAMFVCVCVCVRASLDFVFQPGVCV